MNNRGDDDVGMLVEHRPGEAQYPPAVRDQPILPPSVRLEQILILLVPAAINLNCEFDAWECDVDVIQAAIEEHPRSSSASR